MLKVIVNGEPRELPDQATVGDLVSQLGLAGRAVAVAVERNRQVVPRREHEQAPLRDGDVLEVVTLVGGG
ncbi:MAG: sulfur carrier protein ThiS [Phycisphaeraceae bacterium]